MSLAEIRADQNLAGEEVLTLPEAATFLRVSEEAVSKLVDDRAIPAQRIGDEWRFSKRALSDWLRFGPRHYEDFRRFAPPWMFDHPMWEEFFHFFTKRILAALPAPAPPPPKPGSKEAVRKHFGIWGNDPTAEGMLADIYQRRRGEE